MGLTVIIQKKTFDKFGWIGNEKYQNDSKHKNSISIMGFR